MLLEVRLLMSIIIVILLFLIVTMLRKQRMELKYCLVWIFSLVGVAIFTVSPELLDRLSSLLGIATPVFTLFLICIAFLTCICISLTIVVSRLSARLRELVQNVAILENESDRNIKVQTPEVHNE